MTWNYRLLRHDNQTWGPSYSVHEVYYEEDGTPSGWTIDAIGARGDTKEEARSDYVMMAQAFIKPVLVVTVIDDNPPKLVEE